MTNLGEFLLFLKKTHFILKKKKEFLSWEFLQTNWIKKKNSENSAQKNHWILNGS
jgi:hypothetical protein